MSIEFMKAAFKSPVIYSYNKSSGRQFDPPSHYETLVATKYTHIIENIFLLLKQMTFFLQICKHPKLQECSNYIAGTVVYCYKQ